MFGRLFKSRQNSFGSALWISANQRIEEFSVRDYSRNWQGFSVTPSNFEISQELDGRTQAIDSKAQQTRQSSAKIVTALGIFAQCAAEGFVDPARRGSEGEATSIFEKEKSQLTMEVKRIKKNEWGKQNKGVTESKLWEPTCRQPIRIFSLHERKVYMQNWK